MPIEGQEAFGQLAESIRRRPHTSRASMTFGLLYLMPISTYGLFMSLLSSGLYIDDEYFDTGRSARRTDWSSRVLYFDQ